MNPNNFLAADPCRAYSYIRFSTHKQSAGDSLRRQLEMAKSYAEEHGLKLDGKFSYRDLGVSAYDKSNLERGALALFIDAVKRGLVPKGSFLLVEAFDRLSRAQIPVALRLLLDLVEAGVRVVTLMDERIWDAESVADVGNLLVSIILMSKAHEESHGKAKRLRQAWANKRRSLREGGVRVLTAEVPRWLRVRPDRSGFEVIVERARSVKRVFELTRDGLGGVAIVRKANQEGWAVPGKGTSWHMSLVTRLLNNRSVLGEFQPRVTKPDGTRVADGEPILTYFPRIIEDALFLQALAAKAQRSGLPRKRDSGYRNIFQGLLTCACCGMPFVRRRKGGKRHPGYALYCCSNRPRGASTCAYLPARQLELQLIDFLVQNSFGHFVVADAATAHRERLLTVNGAIAANDERRTRLAAAIALGDGAMPSLVSLLEEAERVHTELRHDRAEVTCELDKLSESVGESRLAEAVTVIAQRLDDPEQAEYRAMLHQRIASVVQQIFIFPDMALAAVRWQGSDEVVGVPLSDAVDIQPSLDGLCQVPEWPRKHCSSPTLAALA